MPTKVKVLSDLLHERIGQNVDWDVCQRHLKSGNPPRPPHDRNFGHSTAFA
jgi:hypothetical protein